MKKGTTEDRVHPATLTVCLSLALLMPTGCREKEPSEGTGQEIVAEERTPASTEQVAWAEASEKADLRILYAGLPDTDRVTDFVGFLAAHFEQVEATDYMSFKEDDSVGFDVTIIDYDGLDADPSKALRKLSRQYAHAAIAVGAPGAHICSHLALKTGYS